LSEVIRIVEQFQKWLFLIFVKLRVILLHRVICRKSKK